MGSTLGVFVLLTALRPGGGAGEYYATQMATLAGNLQELWQYHLRHPAVLMLLLPALGAALYRPGPDQQDGRFLRWLAPFALAHLPIYLLLTLFRESRALVPFVIVVLPPALLALQERMEVAGEGSGP
jgi:hypothetical protein